MQKPILIAGGTGNLGARIIKSLLAEGAPVRAVVRLSSDPEKLNQLEKLGVEIIKVDMLDLKAMTQACMGVSCVVSALAGLREVIIDTQKVLLDAAIAAGVPRFIPSDYALDFTRIPGGNNRNLDLRREFHTYLDQAPIAATSIFNGPFADMLTAEMPMVLFKQHRILYWGNADQRIDFTTMDDTAAFTAKAALDVSTPRFLRIAGDQISPRELASVMTDLTGKKFGMLRPGGLTLLGILIKIARTLAPGGQELYPAWQGMQYMRDMMDGRGKMLQIDNERYAGLHWTTARDVLAAHLAATIV
jgi:nucleoside-diphosphate-sugar epimerase